ncbi:MAG: MFS transporter [Chloroflexota bacterium]|nr:MFS transporter [Chloroflexota bacterium]
MVYVAALAESTIALFLVAETALLPTLVDERLLLSANSLNAVSLNMARLTGPALAGLIVGTFGLPAVVLIDMASYTLAAAMTALVRVTPVQRCPGERAQPDMGSPLGRTWREWRDGLRLVQSDRLLSGIFVVWGLAAVAEGTFEVLSVPWVKQSLHGGALQFGWLMSAQAIGGVMGGLLTGWAGRRLGPVALIGISLLSIDAADLAIWNVPMLPFDLVVIALVGLPAIGFTAGTTTLLQSSVSDRFRGRVSGALGTTWAALILFGMGAATIFGGAIGVVTVLNAAGVLSLLTGVLVFVLLGSLRSNAEPVQEREVSA